MSHFRMGVGRGDLLSGVSGIVVHDNWASYGKMENVVHGLCNAHHLRELQALVDIEKEAWAAMMQVILLDAKKAADTARENGRGHVAANVIKVINERYDACIAQGLSLHENQPPLKPAPPGKATRGRPKRRTGHNLVLRLRDRKADVLRFLTDLRVPFTNNEAGEGSEDGQGPYQGLGMLPHTGWRGKLLHTQNRDRNSTQTGLVDNRNPSEDPRSTHPET